MNIERKNSLNILTVAISVALSIGQGTAQAHFKPLSGLKGSNGFVINGVSPDDLSGFSVSAAGDINGDGIGDVIIGARGAGSDAGAGYIVFGSQQAFASSMELSSLDGSNGFVINGVNPDDSLGFSVSAAGDFNGDGFDDVIIGATGSPGGSNFGTSYVIFGSDKGFPSPLDLSSLENGSGVVINGVTANDYSGSSVSAAGDINGDGIDDLIIGAPYASPNGSYSGASYVVFGSDQGLVSPLNLSTLNGSNGFVINGVKQNDYAGGSVSAAGDINGDGIDDLVIGARHANPNGSGSGASYVVFGSQQVFTNPLELSGLNGSNGFAINGESAGDNSGRSVSNAGDINGDGIDDLVIGAPYSVGSGGSFSGASYLIFGSKQVFTSPLELSGLNGSNGIEINGSIAGGLSGRSVSATGDINSDGIDDLIIGAPGTFVFEGSPGTSYVVYGSKQNLPHPLSLADLNGRNGFAFNGIKIGDGSGGSVSAAGDINGDGTNDLIIGADGADPNGNNSGASYVIFGIDEIFANSFE